MRVETTFHLSTNRYASRAALFLAELIIGVSVAAKPRPRTWTSVTGFGTRAKAQNKTPLHNKGQSHKFPRDFVWRPLKYKHTSIDIKNSSPGRTPADLS
jgi:hypothetical protein